MKRKHAKRERPTTQPAAAPPWSWRSLVSSQANPVLFSRGVRTAAADSPAVTILPVSPYGLSPAMRSDVRGDCIVKAIRAFNGRSDLGPEALTTPSAMASLLGLQLLLHMGPATHCALLGHMTDRTTAFLVNVMPDRAKRAGACEPAAERITRLEELGLHQRRIVCTVFDTILYAGGHCLTITPPVETCHHTENGRSSEAELRECAQVHRWRVLDSFRVDAGVPELTRVQLMLLLCGADSVLF